MAHEVKTVEQRAPQTLEGATNRSPGANRPIFVPPADIYETGGNIAKPRTVTVSCTWF